MRKLININLLRYFRIVFEIILDKTISNIISSEKFCMLMNAEKIFLYAWKTAENLQLQLKKF